MGNSTIWKQEEIDQLSAFLGPRIKAARKAMNMTQRDIAQLVGISTEYFGRMERGHALPSLKTLFKVLGVLGIGIGDFFALGPDGTPEAMDSSSFEFWVEVIRQDPEAKRAFVTLLKMREKIMSRVRANTDR